MLKGLTRQRPGELPLEVTGFVGRQRELAELGGLLRSARLVTVTGPGGVGKTRVALRAAAQLSGEFADGACLVELSGLHDPELLPDTIATCLGLPGTEPRSQLDAIIEHLRDQRMLLILDTCEHLVDACAMLADVLLRASVVTVLATSRQPLAVPGEHTCAIAPLPVPDRRARNAGDGDAVELFAQCAVAVVPGFAVTDANRDCVIRLCRRLDGVPLAIELATRRLRAIPLEQLADRLEDRFRLLTGGRRAALPHHQTIRAATEWSYDLCSPAEQLLWARLTVFAGSFDTEAVEQVCAGGALDREDILATLIGLVDKSVVLRTNGLGAGGEDTRYLLLETIREFGAEKLAAPGEQAAPSELQTLRDRHIARYLAMATALADDPTAEDQLSRYRQLWTEQANLRAALDYALAAPGRQRDAARLANALSMYWQMASSPGEGRFWLGRVLPLFWGPSRERALALINAGYLASLQGETGDGIASLEKGLAVAEQLQDTGARARGYLYLSTALTFARPPPGGGGGRRQGLRARPVRGRHQRADHARCSGRLAARGGRGGRGGTGPLQPRARPAGRRQRGALAAELPARAEGLLPAPEGRARAERPGVLHRPGDEARDRRHHGHQLRAGGHRLAGRGRTAVHPGGVAARRGGIAVADGG